MSRASRYAHSLVVAMAASVLAGASACSPHAVVPPGADPGSGTTSGSTTGTTGPSSVTGSTSATGSTSGATTTSADGDASALDAKVADANEAEAADPYRCPPLPDASAAGPVSQCKVSGRWGAGLPVPIPATGADQLIAVTPDELTIAWSAAAGSAPSVLVADRTSQDAMFGAPQELRDLSISTISPDGLRLVGLDATGLFSELTRAARSGPFVDAGKGAFALLDADAMTQGLHVGNAVISQDDRTLYYTAFVTDMDAHPLRVATRNLPSDPWPVGKAIEMCELQAFGALARYPTGVSGDRLTLFFFDPTHSVTRAGWRQSIDGAFTSFVDLGDMQQAQPNAACDRLYYSGRSAAGASVILAAPAN